MADTHHPLRKSEEELVPRFFGRLMFALMFAALAIVTVARITDRPLEATPPETPVLTERSIYLSGTSAGAARVLDANGTLLADLSPEAGGFVAGIERVIHRERAKIGADQSTAVILRLREGHRLSLHDPLTGWSADLMGFGADNLRTFARLLEPISKGGSQ